jgi:hypothetical protein
MAERRSDAPLADEPQPGAIPDDTPPSGLPEGIEEDAPMGPEEGDPDGEGERSRGEDVQPGIQRDEPDAAG